MFVNLYGETMEVIEFHNYTKKDVKNVWLSGNKVISFKRFCEFAKKINYNNKINDFDNGTCNLDGTKRKENINPTTVGFIFKINPTTRIYFNDGNFLRRSVMNIFGKEIEYWKFEEVNPTLDIRDDLEDEELIPLVYNR